MLRIKIGASIIIKAVVRVPYYDYCIIYPKTLVSVLRPPHYMREPDPNIWACSTKGVAGVAVELAKLGSRLGSSL